MKPTIIRNKTIFKASLVERSRLLCSHLSKDLQNKYNKRTIRVTEGDSVRVMRGEFKGVAGKITKVSAEKNGVAIEGIKKEKLKGGNVDVFIHTSNLLVTDLSTDDKWRQNKLEGKSPKPAKESKPKEPTPPKEVKQEVKEKPKEVASKPKKEDVPKAAKSKENKESKAAKKTKEENTK